MKFKVGGSASRCKQCDVPIATSPNWVIPGFLEVSVEQEPAFLLPKYVLQSQKEYDIGKLDSKSALNRSILAALLIHSLPSVAAQSREDGL